MMYEYIIVQFIIIMMNLTQVVIQGEFVIVPYLDDQLRRSPGFSFIQIPKMVL